MADNLIPRRQRNKRGILWSVGLGMSQQPIASLGGSQFQHTSHPTTTRRTMASSVSSSSPRNVDKHAPSAAGSTSNPTTVPLSRSRDVKCWKCKGHGHIYYECQYKRVLFISEQGEWESESEHEDSGVLDDHEDEEGEKNGCDIHDDVGVALFPVMCLVSMQLEKRKGNDLTFFTPVAPTRQRFKELFLTMAAAITLPVEI